jgi:CRISPR-associated protein Cas1
LGYEGNIAKIFFSSYFAEMNWKGRKPRTKYDITNTLLDRGYTTLFNFVESLLRIYGFDIYCGIYHQFFFQRKSLVCDIVEPFRCIIDQSIRKANNLQIIDKKDFEAYDNQFTLPYKNSKKYSKIFLEAIMNHKEEIFLYIQSYYRCFITDKTSKIPNFII